MTRTRVRKFPLLLGGVAVIAVMAFMATAGGDQDLPQNTSANCDDSTAEVEFGAEMGSRSRPVRIRYWVTGSEVIAHDIQAEQWRTVDPAMPCGTTAYLTVNAADVWGGDTECWIEVNGRRVAEHRTRLSNECKVTVRLIR